MMLMQCFCVLFNYHYFLYKSICYGYSLKLHQQVDAFQMGTHNICLYKEVDKKYTGCNLKTTELIDCVLIEVCAVIRLNTVHSMLLMLSTGGKIFSRQHIEIFFLIFPRKHDLTFHANCLP